MQTKKVLPSLVKGIHIIFLVVFLLSAWLIFGFLKLIKGNNWVQNQKSILGIHPAQADVPQGGGGGGGGGGSTPFLAFWNGIKYVFENDFLFGQPRSYFSNFAEGKKEYEAGRVTPDLYKIQNPFKPKNNKLSFQIHEIEPEESFFNGLNLLRIIHSAASEVVVDSQYNKFYVFEKNVFSRKFIEPKAVRNNKDENLVKLADKNNFWKNPDREDGVFFEKNDYLNLKFDNLKPGAKYFLALKSRYRVWVMGEDPSALARARFYAGHFIRSKIVAKAATAALLIFGFWLSGKNTLAGLLSPLFMLSDGGGGGGAGGRCFPVFYRSHNGDNRYVSISTIWPRALNYNSELLELPREAVSNSGEMDLRVLATERHYVGFVGLAEDFQEVPCRTETLEPKKAYHQRLKSNVGNLLKYQTKRYLHVIPGDVVDLEFEKPESKLSAGQKETYLIRSAGFYTYLSPESKKMAGNWEERISDEAKKRLATLSPHQ